MSESLTNTTVSEHAVNRLYANLLDILGNRSVGLVNITSILVNLMSLAQATSLKGPLKKELVIKVLNRYIEQKVDTSTDEGKELMLFVQLTSPSLIDTMIALENGQIAIKLRTCCGMIKKNRQPVELTDEQSAEKVEQL